ncbi:Centrosomal protein [Chionoecetes opilio]|uniref:Centrosomal protein of 19 kDa n=1 Tax=Chionoecetes opilio TaxID=41210 RepID=A0A8J4XNU0_CHIOP|nr:Centrosomal protein [Chionoecetes opilio]
MEPLKLGVRTHPPGLTLVYRSAEGKERYRVMPIRFLNKFGSVENVLKEMKDRHMAYLEKVPDVKMEKMLHILQEVDRGRNLEEAAAAVAREYSVDPDQDLNKLDDTTLDKKKKVMNTSFEKNCIRPGDPDYEYDKQVDFRGGENVEAGWDSPEEDFWS